MRRWCLLALLLAGCLAVIPLPQALAQAPKQTPTTESVPFFDTTRKPERPDLSGIRAIRFLTDDDYPPFHFPGPDGQLTGFNVDLARAICFELKVACTIQSRRWDTLLAALEEGRGDVIIASMSDTGETRSKVDFGIPYYRSPGRFVTRKDAGLTDISIQGLADRTVAVVGKTAHAAFLATFYPKVKLTVAADQDEALRLLTTSKADAVFSDGVGLALWLNGQTGGNCCQFVGGPFFEPHFFGSGAAMAFRKDSAQLRRGVDHALFRLAEQGIYQNLMLKYFPVSFY